MRRTLLLLAGVFAASQAVSAAVGLHFDTGNVTAAVQSVDPQLLRTHFWQTLWNLHGQPPLWNGLVGVTLNLFPAHWPQVWHVVFLALGLVEILALFLLLIELGLGQRAAAVIAAVFALTPVMLFEEVTFFYDFPTLVAVTVTTLAAARFIHRQTLGRASLLFGAAAYLVLTRTLFQIWWMLLLLVVVLVAAPSSRRVVLTAAIVPFALVLAVYVKNWVVFGVPSTTSWTGMGVARAAVQALSPGERERLVAEGKLHRVSLVTPLAPLVFYERAGVKLDPPTGIPLLDATHGAGTTRNLENHTYIRISRMYWHDDLWVIEHRPGAYLRSVVSHGMRDFFSTVQVEVPSPNETALGAYYRRGYGTLYGQAGPGGVAWVLVVAYALAFGAGLAWTARRLRPGASAANVAIAVATLFVLYVGLTGNLAEVGENYRFRFVLDPLVLALCSVLVARGLRAATARRRTALLPPQPPGEAQLRG